MEECWSRMTNLIGENQVKLLQTKKVLIFGAGGVGGYAIEALARCAIGTICIVDGDEIAPSNINRQILATTKTIGLKKAEVAKERVLSINPECKVQCISSFYTPDNRLGIDFEEYDYVIDCIDMVKSKLDLIEQAKTKHVSIISCMGTGNKLNPMGFYVTDITKTEMDPLARSIRIQLKKRGITNLKVVCSKEKPQKENNEGERTPASISFVPPVAGLLLASEVVRDLLSST